MTNYEPLPSDNSNLGEKIPHSGNLPPEQGQDLPVQEFDNTSLQEAVDRGLLPTPDSPAPLATTTIETTQPSQLRRKLAAAVALIAVGAGSALGISKLTSGNDHDPTTLNNQPVATATVEPTPEPTPTESVDTPTETPETPVTPVEQEPTVITDEYIATVDRDPSKAVIDYSLEPVSEAEFTPDEAVMRLLNDWKLYWLSGETSQSGDISEKETPASLATGAKQLDNIFGAEGVRDEDRLTWDWITGTREYLTLNMGYLITENGYPEDGTFNSKFDILSKKVLDTGEIEYLVKNTWNSNMSELDISVADRDVDATEFSTDRYITIDVRDGNFNIVEIRSRAAE